jgi:16S rRNA processing protein RimM
MVVMGRVTAPFGVQGWFKVFTLTAQPDNLCEYAAWWLQRDGGWQEMKVVSAKVQGNTLVARLAGVETREAAAALRGSDIGVPREQLPDAAKDEFYWADLVGLRVVNVEQQVLGRVVRIVETGANDVLVVADEDIGSGAAREILIPFIADAIKRVDIAAGVIAVDWGRDY